MPSLICCKKRWNAGTDDFVIPAFIALVLRVPWLLVSISILIVEIQTKSSVCFSFVHLLMAYTISHIIIQVIILGLEATIMSVSARGSVMEPEKRRSLPIFLGIRAVFFFLESAVILWGTILLSVEVQSQLSDAVEDADESNSCSSREGALIKPTTALVVISWFLQALIVVCFFYYIDLCGLFLSPVNSEETDLGAEEELMTNDGQLLLSADELRRRTVVHNGRHRVSVRFRGLTRFGESTKRLYNYQGIQQRQWFKKLHRLCCNNSGGSAKALNDIASSFAIIFQDSNYVLSDVVAGLKLLSHLHTKVDGAYQREIEYMRKLTINQLKRGQLPANYTYEPPRPLDFSNPEERSVFVTGMYYLKYAVGIYGWPIHLFLNPLCGICKLTSAMRCRVCCSCAPRNVMYDNCLISNFAAFKLQTGCEDEDMLYCSFDNDLYSAPFAVILDHSKKSVVITIRGSLSVKDILTDLTVSLKRFTIHEEPYCDMKTYIHVGMHSTAVTIKNVLLDKEILSEAFDRHPEYSLIIVGHSLGAGVATALGLILREHFPNLRCYTYSPIGCAFNFPVMEYTKEFVISFVIGKDMIPRVTLRSLIHMSNSMSLLLKHNEKPKYNIILGTWLDYFSCRSNPTSCALPESSLSSVLFSVYCAKKWGSIWLTKARGGYSRSFKDYFKKEIVIPTFAPGRIVLIQAKNTLNTSSCCHESDPEMEVLWYPNEDLGVIHIGQGTIDHHVPNEVLAGFKRVEEQFNLSSDSSQ